MTTWNLRSVTLDRVGPITVAPNGTPTLAFEVAFVPTYDIPVESDWEPPTVVDGQAWVVVGVGSAHPLTRGEYAVWTRYDTGSTRPADVVGTVKVA